MTAGTELLLLLMNSTSSGFVEEKLRIAWERRNTELGCCRGNGWMNGLDDLGEMDGPLSYIYGVNHSLIAWMTTRAQCCRPKPPLLDRAHPNAHEFFSTFV